MCVVDRVFGQHWPQELLHGPYYLKELLLNFFSVQFLTELEQICRHWMQKSRLSFLDCCDEQEIKQRCGSISQFCLKKIEAGNFSKRRHVNIFFALASYQRNAWSLRSPGWKQNSMRYAWLFFKLLSYNWSDYFKIIEIDLYSRESWFVTTVASHSRYFYLTVLMCLQDSTVVY